MDAPHGDWEAVQRPQQGAAVAAQPCRSPEAAMACRANASILMRNAPLADHRLTSNLHERRTMPPATPGPSPSPDPGSSAPHPSRPSMPAGYGIAPASAGSGLQDWQAID